MKTMTENFDAGIGWGALQDKDYAKAATELKAAVEANRSGLAKGFEPAVSAGAVVLAADSARLSERYLVRGSRCGGCASGQRRPGSRSMRDRNM